MPRLAAVVGIDTDTQLLYGILYDGDVYCRIRKSSRGFHLKTQIEETLWTQIESQISTTEAKLASELSALPSVPNSNWIFKLNSNDKWTGKFDVSTEAFVFFVFPCFCSALSTYYVMTGDWITVLCAGLIWPPA